ncbi:MAG: Asp-tRNA(Asn)/Glu-tRNA(Gln) amidotransferase subunit GatC [Patescibacteria group bacterium]
MPSPITKATIAHLANLTRLRLTPAEEERLLHDLQKILEHFEELSAVETTGVPPMTGGTAERNVFRDDAERENTNRGAGKESFPETEDGYLKIPGVF